MSAYTRPEVADLSINQLSDVELDQALIAFNGFRVMFDRTWVDNYFQGAKAPSFVRSIMEMWSDFTVIKNLPNSRQIVDRWRGGVREQGVVAELRILRQLHRVGFAIELFPSVGGRVPDARVRLSTDQPWTYVEASRRSISQTRSDSESLMNCIAIRASDVRPGVHSKVALLHPPDRNELQRILSWLDALPQSGSALENLAMIWIEPIDMENRSHDELEQVVPQPFLFMTRIATGDLRKMGTVCMTIRDVGAERIFREESKQLPPSDPGILIIDTSSVLNGTDIWQPLIQRRFQPTINTRIGAVVLTEWINGRWGRESDSVVLTNPHASIPIDRTVVAKLNEAFPAK